MQRQVIIWALTLSLVGIITSSAGAQQWAMKANAADACSCASPCPCTFGNPPTLGDHCYGNMLLEMKKSHYGDVHFDGLSIIITYDMGKWMKIYVSEKASDDQVKAIKKLMEKGKPLPLGKVLSIEKATVSVERTDSRVKYSVPASSTEIEMTKGANGEPTRVLNPPSAGSYTVYKTIKVSHKSKDHKFSYSGTHGSTFILELEGNSEG